MTEPTKPKTPCVHCGKPIGKAMLKHFPYTDVCGQHCFVGEALNLWCEHRQAQFEAGTR